MIQFQAQSTTVSIEKTIKLKWGKPVICCDLFKTIDDCICCNCGKQMTFE